MYDDDVSIAIKVAKMIVKWIPTLKCYCYTHVLLALLLWIALLFAGAGSGRATSFFDNSAF